MITEREYNDTASNPLYPHVYYSVPGTDDFQHVAAFSDGTSYDWTDWVCWYSPSRRRYFILSGSGCSCNSLADEAWDLGSFESVATKEAAKDALRRFVDARYDYEEPRRRPRLDDEIGAINAFRVKVPGDA